MPERIQRQRTRGWRMPEGAVYVGRPTRWGNPYAMGGVEILGIRAGLFTREEVVEAFRQAGPPADIDELRGKDLACWCPLDEPCHADVLLEWANPDSGANR